MADESKSVSFSVDGSQRAKSSMDISSRSAEGGGSGSGNGGDREPSRSSTMKRNSLRSSFFKMRSMSFRRSGGDRGADINTLRGTSGPDFEGYAIVNRSDEGGLCGCFGGGGDFGDDNSEKIVLIKGPYCFVFNNERDPSPKYAVGAAHMKPVLHPKESQGRFVVTIETNLGDIEYELKFDKENIAKQFVDSFRQQAAIGEADEIRKRLGHGKLLNKRASVEFAEKVATKKMEDQPEKKEKLTMNEMERVQPGMAF